MVFMLLAVGGIGILGIAPSLTKDRKLFVDTETRSENKENDGSSADKSLNFQADRL